MKPIGPDYSKGHTFMQSHVWQGTIAKEGLVPEGFVSNRRHKAAQDGKKAAE